MAASIIFDFDGTLYRDEEAAYEAYRAALLDLIDVDGSENPERLVETARNAVRKGQYTSTRAFLADQGFLPDSFEDSIYPVVCQAAARTDRSGIIDDLQNAGLRVDVMTNNSELLVKQYLEQVGREVTAVVGAETLPVLKPNKESFVTFFGEIPYNPDDALYVDNDVENIQLAASLGMETLHLNQDTRIDDVVEVIQ